MAGGMADNSLMAQRDRFREEGEPLLTKEVNAQESGGESSSITITVPSEFVQMQDVKKGDALTVDIFRDLVVVQPSEG